MRSWVTDQPRCAYSYFCEALSVWSMSALISSTSSRPIKRRAYLYRPLVLESECVAAASESFLDRVFGGGLKPMLAHFVERKQLSAEEYLELKELLESREPGSPQPSKRR